MVFSFEDLCLHPALMKAVEQMGFEQPTPIQQAAIPFLLEGRNVVAQAQTGTGKTAAFALPMLHHLLAEESQPFDGRVRALVLAPTRELAIQVAEATSRMGKNSPVRVMAVYGGQSYDIQKRQLKRGVEVVVGTPGRLLDLIRQGVLDLSQVQYLVLDEADEMLEMGFIEDVETILSEVSENRQTALFSATMPAPVRKLADRYLNDPEEIAINPTRLTVADTEQLYIRVREENKQAALIRFLEAEEVKSALIFARTKARAQELADALIQAGYPAEALHGDLSQARRETVLNRFRRHNITLLVATDVAARGLDIENVSHVFNYDAPGDPEDYVHRIGRTGRAGRKGIAITFFNSRDVRVKLKAIEAYTRQPLKETAPPSREEILAKRDERFIERLSEQIGKGSISDSFTARERALIARLTSSAFDLVDIAAAAIQLARAGESELPAESLVEPAETRPARKSKRQRMEAEQPQAAGYSKKGEKRSGEKRSWDRPAKGDRRKAVPPSGGFGRQETGMIRLKMNLGEVHGLRPGDVVGAIASEVGIPGRAIGDITIRKNFTLVDVAEKHVMQVLAHSTGQYSLRGKPVMLKLAH
ncbi:MAG: DEAD/DEAH box helicase [Chloroflexi bacterium]|nr:DEAD/DEAH box helicase [Chloroflexota bacterium]